MGGVFFLSHTSIHKEIIAGNGVSEGSTEAVFNDRHAFCDGCAIARETLQKKGEKLMKAL